MRVLKTISVILILLSIVLITSGFIMGLKTDDIEAFFSNTHKYTKQDQIVYNEEITTINLDVETKSLLIKTHSQDSITIDHYKSEADQWDINLDNKTLNINQKVKKKLFRFNFGFEKSEYRTIIIKIPINGFYNLNLTTNTGNINIDGLTINLLDINVDTGDVNINNSNINAKTLIKTDTGNIKLMNTNTKEVNLKSSTGNVILNEVNAEKLDSKISTGTYHIKSLNSDNINLTTSTGNINIEGNYQNYSLELSTNTGKVRINGETKTKYYEIEKELPKISAKTNTGSINLKTN